MKRAELFLLLPTLTFCIVDAADAADLPPRNAAPPELMHACGAHDQGFFLIPGTDTCLRIGGTIVAEEQLYSVSYRMANTVFGQPNPFVIPAGGFLAGAGFTPSVLQYGNPTGAPISTFQAVGRVELDGRTSTDLGTLRTFLRVESIYGTEGNAATGSLSGASNFIGGNYNNNTAFFATTRETTILNKGFIQFAGLTAGRAQSFFDFYADAINFEMLRGSNATAGVFAYTFDAGNGLSSSFSIEDSTSRRDYIGSTIGNFNLGPFIGFPGSGTAFAAVPAGGRIPELVANLRWEGNWGAFQLSGAAHQLRTTLYPKDATSVNPVTYAFPAASSEDFGFALQAGVRLDLGHIDPEIFPAGDKLWIQATYEQGATGYVMGNNLNFNGGPVNANIFYGYGNGGVKAGNGWNYRPYDCIWTAENPRHCDKSEGFVALAAIKHYWTPTLASGLYGSYMGLRYSHAAVIDAGGGVGAVNTDEFRIATNLIWSPVKNFDLGSEVMYVRANHLNRPMGLAPDPWLVSVGLPAWKGVNGAFEGRVRAQRSF
jgi:hypothetical protein